MSTDLNVEMFRDLLDKYLNETMTTAEFDEFESYLKIEEYRDLYIKLVHQDSVLYQIFEKVEIEDKTPLRIPLIVKSLAAAIILFTPVLLWLFNTNEKAESFDAFIVSNTANCTWVRGVGENDDLIELRSGVAKLNFKDGSSVVIEAPIKFRQIGSNKIFLQDGNLYVKGKPDFTVVTEKDKIVDIGTEFGVSIDDNTRIQVHKGHITVSNKSVAKLDLSQGDAVISNSQAIDKVEFLNSYFLRDIPKAPENARMKRNANFPGSVPYNINKYDYYSIHKLSADVMIDGQLNEWDKKGVFKSACRVPFEDSHNITGQIKYSEKGIYVGLIVKDPNPMVNALAIDSDNSWNAGAQQLWFSKGQERISLTLLYSALNEKSYLLKSVNESESKIVGSKDYLGRHLKLSDSEYCLEYFISWKTLGFTVENDEKISFHFTSHWGDKSGIFWDCFLEEFQSYEYFHFDRKKPVTWGYAEFK